MKFVFHLSPFLNFRDLRKTPLVLQIPKFEHLFISQACFLPMLASRRRTTDVSVSLPEASESHPRGGGGTPLYGLYRYVRPKWFGFSAVLVIDRVSILANFGHFSHKWGMVFAL